MLKNISSWAWVRIGFALLMGVFVAFILLSSDAKAATPTPRFTETCQTLPAYASGMNFECRLQGAVWFRIVADSTSGSLQFMGWSLKCGTAYIEAPHRLQAELGVSRLVAGMNSPPGPERAAYKLLSRTQKSCVLNVTIEPQTGFSGGAFGLVSWGFGPKPRDSITSSSF